ncbi:MAG: PDDEXK nuclease domain-containing protein [Nocardioides sp.]
MAPPLASAFKDAYSVEFLNLQAGHTEADLHSGLLGQLRTFLIELGRDFCFVGSEFPVQVGGRDFALDLLFFHRGLNCLVAIELKVDRFEPEHLGKLNFYLEALDRDVRKPHENPAIGVLLCASKDSEVVEYALSRIAVAGAWWRSTRPSCRTSRCWRPSCMSSMRSTHRSLRLKLSLRRLFPIGIDRRRAAARSDRESHAALPRQIAVPQ